MTPDDALENLRRWAEGERDEALARLEAEPPGYMQGWYRGHVNALCNVIARIEAEQREETGA